MPPSGNPLLWAMATPEENPKRVSPYWMYATVTLAGLVIVQALWWNAKAPNVLKELGDGGDGGY